MSSIALAHVSAVTSRGLRIPPFEAALLGVPSICSNRLALNELLEDATLFVDPFLPQDWLAAIRMLQSDRSRADEIAYRAGEMARALTWERAAETLASIFAEVAEETV
jgi:glycosyltransferase involved in cell wall biosynthesis